MYKCQIKIVSEFVEKLLKNRIMFKVFRTDYRDFAYNIILCCPWNQC